MINWTWPVCETKFCGIILHRPLCTLYTNYENLTYIVHVVDQLDFTHCPGDMFIPYSYMSYIDIGNMHTYTGRCFIISFLFLWHVPISICCYSITTILSLEQCVKLAVDLAIDNVYVKLAGLLQQCVKLAVDPDILRSSSYRQRLCKIMLVYEHNVVRSM